jgi:4-hydroxy-tetrahydrodipicolinate synthase
MPVMCGVMDSSTRRVIDNIKALEQMGGKVAVITPVFYARHATPDETVRHFEEISKATNIDLMIYNIPLYTGTTLKAETIFKIAEIDKVIGYKDTSGSMPDFIKCLDHFRGTDFILLQGSTALAAPSLLMGGDGYIPSMAPLFPAAHLKLYEYGKAGNISETMKWNKIMNDISAIWPMAASQTSSTKYAISTAGLCDKRVIKPTEPITADQEKKIDKQIEKINKEVADLLEEEK